MKNLIFFMLIVVLTPGRAQIKTEPFRIGWDWQQQAKLDRHTSLLVSFDNTGEMVAQYTRGFNKGDIYRGQLGSNGKWGASIELKSDASIGNFKGGLNINSNHGIVEMWVKSGTESNIWTDGREHWLFSAQGETQAGTRTIGLYKRAKDNALVFFEAPNWGGRPERSIVLNPGNLAADQWHYILISWEHMQGRLWLAVNGTGVTGAAGESFASDPFYILWLGSSGNDRQSFAALGGYIDHLRISDCTVEERNNLQTKINKAVDIEALSTAEITLHNWFGFMETVQTGGGWANCYTYPTLLPSATGKRHHILPEGYVTNDKGHIGPAVCWLIYSSQVLNEPWYLGIAEKMANAYLSAQFDEGCWAYGYWARPGGLVPETEGSKVKLQDQNQVHPMYLLLYLYRITNKKQYLDGAMKAGEFLLSAQNPNGSWSHSFDLKKKIGLTARGYLQGGEINDNACSDNMTAMLMMYHFTKEKKYLEAYVRCADWFLKAQLGPPTWGWAMQYDSADNPVEARLQEPPSVSIGAGYIATNALREAYWLTGDPRYLKAPEKFFQWMISISKERKYSSWYDLKTGRPIVSAPEANGKVFYIDDPVQLDEFMKTSVLIDYARMSKRDPEGMIEQIKRDLQSNKPPQWAPEPDLNAAASTMTDYIKDIYKNKETQNESGAWTNPGQGLLSAAGNVVWIEQDRVREMLLWVENARMLIGELPVKFRGQGEIEKCAYPFNDWYDTPLRSNN